SGRDVSAFSANKSFESNISSCNDTRLSQWTQRKHNSSQGFACKRREADQPSMSSSLPCQTPSASQNRQSVLSPLPESAAAVSVVGESDDNPGALDFSSRRDAFVGGVSSPQSARDCSEVQNCSASAASHANKEFESNVGSCNDTGLLQLTQRKNNNTQGFGGNRREADQPSMFSSLPRRSSQTPSAIQTNTSTSQKRQSALSRSTESATAVTKARASSESETDRWRSLKPHLPSFDINSILESNTLLGHKSFGFMKELKETGFIEKKGRLWVMKCLASHLYENYVDKSKNHYVTMEMKEGMAKSFVLAYPKFGKCTAANETEMPWSVVVEVRQPSGFLYYSCRTFMKKNRARKTSKKSDDDDDDTSHLNQTELLKAEMKLLQPDAKDMCRTFTILKPAILKLQPLKPIELFPSDSIKDMILKRREVAATNNETVQPYLIVVENPVTKKILETFLVLDNKPVQLKISSLLHGLDMLFSSFFAFNASYPYGWRNTFHFIQTCFYEIFEGEKDK
ncbi:hypothetical protein KUF71_003387, partial [Frankliniella fusca]